MAAEEEITARTCEDCGQPATVYTSIAIDGITQELCLCRGCAEKRKLVVPDQLPDLKAILKHFAGNMTLIPSELAKLQCPDCGIKYMEFRRQGRLGCPYDYVIFRAGLEPLLERVQRAKHHKGKRPKRQAAPVEQDGAMRNLRHQLKQAVAAEDYEKAAQLRDLIRTKDPEHGI